MLARVGHPHNKAISLRPDECCEVCGIRIFGSEAEARVNGVPFYAHINGRCGNKCTGCAHDNPFIGLIAEQQIGDDMKKNQELILAVETGVRSPKERKRKGVSKYDPIQVVIDKASFGEWIRIQVPSTKDASAAKAHFRKLEKADALPYDLETSAVSGENGLGWLYAKKEEKQTTESK